MARRDGDSRLAGKEGLNFETAGTAGKEEWKRMVKPVRRVQTDGEARGRVETDGEARHREKSGNAGEKCEKSGHTGAEEVKSREQGDVGLRLILRR